MAAAQARVVDGENDLLAGLVPHAACRVLYRANNDFFAHRESLCFHRPKRGELDLGDRLEERRGEGIRRTGKTR